MNGAEATHSGGAGLGRLTEAERYRSRSAAAAPGIGRRGWRFVAAAFASVAWLTAALPAAEPAEGATAAGDDEEFVDEYATAHPTVWDPFERVNRTMFKFNATVYNRVLRPFSRGYEKVVPAPARRGLKNFFDNAEYPVRFASCVLQGRFDRAGAETGKFALNTTVGLAGFIKVSDRYGVLRVPDEDIGQAFGRWGLGHGPFLVIPVLGPTTLRDGIGRVGDYYATPWNWKFMDEYEAWVRAAIRAGNVISDLPALLATYDALHRAAVDPYVAFRNGYVQYRDGEVKK